MSIRPIIFNPDGSVEVVYDETGHTGTITDINWVTRPDDSQDHNFIILNCPDGCGAISVHPVGGGASPALVQEMFIRKVDRDGCVCPARIAARDAQIAIDHVKQLAIEMDGEDCWQVDESKLMEELT